MSGLQLGRLEAVDLRTVWLSEAGGFTPWLAQNENIALLGDAIGIDLQVEAQEKEVGPFRADILCKDTGNDSWVLIENQLERTDHVHLGQLLTYAAGLNSVSIVWIARRFTDEHRAALDWLNEATRPEIRFFGIEVELWRIGESAIAPKFNVVSQPNDWSKGISEGAVAVQNEGLTEGRQLQLRYWQAFRTHLQEAGSFLKPQKPLPQNWIVVALGRTGVYLTAVTSVYSSISGAYDSHEIRAEVVISLARAKEYFALLEEARSAIETELGEVLVWHNPPSAKLCKVYLRSDVNLRDETDWPRQHEWLRKQLEALHRVFSSRVKNLQLPPAAGDVGLDG